MFERSSGFFMQDLSNLSSLFTLKQSKYCPHRPFAKQAAFMMIPQKEALYGGALGGGKSDALLMAAMQNVDIPGYSALLLRRTLADLKQQEALLDRMTKWLRPYLATKEVKYIASDHKFVFPTFDRKGNRMTDSVIQFGYIGESNAYTRYQGIELQFCGFDEVTQHKENDYNYLITRLRRCVCPIHTERDKNGNPLYDLDCEYCDWVKSIPPIMRATCNPDGIGLAWVKKRFQISPKMTQEEADEQGIPVPWIGKNKKKPYISASYKDNPYLDNTEYEESLKDSLNEDMWAALMEGSWGVIPNARFRKRWQRLYSMRGNLIFLGPNQMGRMIDLQNDIVEIFQTVDSAATAEEGPGDTELFPTKVHNPSHTVISTWALTKCCNLIWLHMVRFREEIPEVVNELRTQYEIWNPTVVIVEDNGVGKGVAQFAERMGMRVQGLHKDKDKVVNATTAILQMKAGRIWTPQDNMTWVPEMEEEVFTWQGHPKENDDIVDTLAHAANHVDWSQAGDPSQYFTVGVSDPSMIPAAYTSRFRYSQRGH